LLLKCHGISGENIRDRVGTYHHFVKYTACRVGHLVELVDTTYTTIAEYKRSTKRRKGSARFHLTVDRHEPFKHKLLGIGITGNISCKTNSRRTFARCIDASGSDFVHIL
jgi:hypothetical protein